MEAANNTNGNGYGNNYECDIIRWFEYISENAGEVQRETLRRILEQNYDVEYLKKRLGDTKIQDMDGCEMETLYTSLVPLASHADLEPYVQRIADGDTASLLTQEPITKLSLSSGTTEGRQKYVPFTKHSSQTTLQIFRLAAAYRSRVYPIREGGRILEFIYSSKQFKTKGGLTAGTATTHYYASEEFKIKQEKTKSFTCSPEEVISSGEYKQSTYCHLLLGLFFSDQVEFITSTFAYSIVQAFTAFEECWQDICIDVREGSLSSSRITLPKMRKAVLDTISPKPYLASKIEVACKKLESLDWFGLVPKLWPNAKYVYSIMTGSMQHYLKKLRHYAGDLPLVSADYGSTESWIGVNVDPSLPPEDVTFAVIPTFSYFEFIPIHRRKQDCNSAIDDFIEDEPVPLSQVKLGQEYEIVLTSFTGLYRYRLGDVVEVAGFHKGTPKLNFVCRRKLMQSLGDSANDKCHMGSSSHTSEDCYNTDLSDMEDDIYMKNHEDYGNCAPGSSKDNISLPQGFIESLMNGELELPFSDKFPLPSTIPCPGDCGEAYYCSKSCAEADWELFHSLLCTGERSKALSRAALLKFIEHANGTNDIFLLAAKVICSIILRHRKLKAAHLEEQGKTNANSKSSNLSLLLEAWKPITIGYKRRWWDCIALPDDVDSSDEASFRMKIRELAFTSLQLLKAAIFDSECEPLFSLEIYGHIIGMFELNNLDLVVASPVEDYFLYIDDLLHGEKKEAEKITRPILDALGDDYSICCQELYEPFLLS